MVILGVGSVVLVLLPPNASAPTTGEAPTNFEECVAAGNPVMESYPRQCNTPQGGHFVEDIGNALEKQDLIRTATHQPNANISSPVTISGEARGTWYFEASFPIEVQNARGEIIGQGHAEAQSEWMTENFVPFTAIVTFTPQLAGSAGKLILKKDNPSGLPEHDDQLIIPVKF